MRASIDLALQQEHRAHGRPPIQAACTDTDEDAAAAECMSTRAAAACSPACSAGAVPAPQSSRSSKYHHMGIVRSVRQVGGSSPDEGLTHVIQ